MQYEHYWRTKHFDSIMQYLSRDKQKHVSTTHLFSKQPGKTKQNDDTSLV